MVIKFANGITFGRIANTNISGRQRSQDQKGGSQFHHSKMVRFVKCSKEQEPQQTRIFSWTLTIPSASVGRVGQSNQGEMVPRVTWILHPEANQQPVQLRSSPLKTAHRISSKYLLHKTEVSET